MNIEIFIYLFVIYDETFSTVFCFVLLLFLFVVHLLNNALHVCTGFYHLLIYFCVYVSVFLDLFICGFV